MFKLLGDTPDHPMYDLAEARRLLAELPHDKPLKALDDLSIWLDSIRDTAGFKPEIRAAVVMLMDEAGRTLHTGMLRQYLAEPHLQDFHGLHLWKNLHAYAQALADAYAACLFEYVRTDRRSGAYREMLPLLCVRQLMASAGRMKLELMRYLEVDAAVWKQLAEAYRLAESEGCADTMLVPFPGQGQHSSPKRELLAALVLYVSSPGTLAADQIEACSRIAQRLSGFFDLGPQPDIVAPWRFDLAESAPPRHDDGEAATEAVRFFGAVRAQPAVLKIVEQNENDPVWLEHRTGSDFTPSGKLTLLKHLHFYWGAVPPHRQSERRAIVAFVDVTHGFRLVCQLVTHIEAVHIKEAGEEADVGLVEPEKIDYTAETWSVTDVSKDGFGVTLARTEGSWIKIGDLCAIRPHNGPKWWVGMVRRLYADGEGKLHAGIEILARNPASAWLRALGKGAETASNWETSSGSFKYTYLPIILLPGLQEDYRDAGMLMEPGSFVIGNVYQVMMGELSRDIRLTRLVSEGEDYERVEFEWLNG